jgi:hypothetical protein
MLLDSCSLRVARDFQVLLSISLKALLADIEKKKVNHEKNCAPTALRCLIDGAGV